MMRRLFRRGWHLVRRRHRYDSVRFVTSMSDVPEQLGATLYVVGSRPHWKWVVLDCPCRSGHRVSVNLMPTRYPYWKLTESAGTISLKPSLWLTDCPDEGHFWLVRNRVRWT